MQFASSHVRKVIGQDVHVAVDASGEETLSRVTTTFDGVVVGDDQLADGTIHYDRTFPSLDARVGAQHTLVVTGFDQNGLRRSATSIWIDPS